MNHTISPLEFLLTNAICFAAGAVVVVALQLAGKAVYRAGNANHPPLLDPNQKCIRRTNQLGMNYVHQ